MLPPLGASFTAVIVTVEVTELERLLAAPPSFSCQVIVRLAEVAVGASELEL
jgi:hypothetical protein